MLHGRDPIKLFRTLAPGSPEELEAFIAQFEGITTAEVVKLLPVILDQRPRTPAGHRPRCQAFVSIATQASGPELFVPCLRALPEADPILRQALVSVLTKANDVHAHDQLCDLMGSPHPETRAAAAEVLRQVGGRSALQILVQRALDPAFSGRLDAMNALVPRAGAHVLPLLAAVVRAGKAFEKIQALRLLASKERFAKDLDGALESAAPALADKDELVCAQAITTCSELGASDLFERMEPALPARGLDVLRAFSKHVARHPSEKVAEFFQQRMREGPKAVRLLLLEVAETVGSDALFPTLVDALSNRDVAVRTRAAHAITALAKAQAIDAARAVVWLLRSPDLNVRRVAAEIANHVANTHGNLAPRLLSFLRDEDWWVRERLLDALIEMNGAALTKHVISLYLMDKSDTVRRFAVSALLRIADPRSLGALVRTAQNDPDWLVSEIAVEAIGALRDPRAVDYLIDLLTRRPELRVATIAALREIKSEDAITSVAELVHDEDADVRTAAILFLDDLDDGAHALWVKGCEDDPSPLVREAAGRLLRRYKLLRSAEVANISELKSIDVLLTHVVAQKADDLILQADRPPFVKRLGLVEALGETPLSGPAIQELLRPHMSNEQRAQMEAGRDVDFSYTFEARGLRFRVNVFAQLTGLAAVFRTVKNNVLGLEQLGIPPVFAAFADLPHGLVLVGGPTGAGKSTTLAAMIDHVNRTSARHIVTIEDPVEVLHPHVKSVVNQREVGAHTKAFATALRATLRQDPDVILVGELRDLETIAFAVSAAETGHLVLGTVHTTTADSTIDRLINAFPSRQQAQVRSMLAESLRAVTCQYLLRSPKGGRVLATEIMLNTDAIQNLIRKGKTFQIPSIIATSKEQGMHLMDSELTRLALEGQVDVADAHAKVLDKAAFEVALGLPPSEETVEQQAAPTSTRQPAAPHTGPRAAAVRGK